MLSSSELPAGTKMDDCCPNPRSLQLNDKIVLRLYFDVCTCVLLDEKVEDEQRQLGALEDTFQQIKNTTGLSDVDDIIDRWVIDKKFFSGFRFGHAIYMRSSWNDASKYIFIRERTRTTSTLQKY